MAQKTPKAPSERQAEREREAIQKGLNETEAPARVEVERPLPPPKKQRGRRAA
jgi:hypothetical protein